MASTNNNNKEQSEFADILVVYSADTGQDAAKALRGLQDIVGDLILIEYIACPSGALDKLPSFDLKLTEQKIDRCKSVVGILSKDSLTVASAVFILANAHKKGKRVVLVHDQASCWFPGEKEQPEEVKELFHDKAITYMRQYAGVCVRAVLKKAMRLSKDYYEICLVYHDSARDVAEKFMKKFQGIKVKPLPFSERRGEKQKDFAKRIVPTIAISRSLVVLLHESMNDKSGKHFLSAPIQIALMLDPKSRCYVMYDEVNTPVMLDAFAKELDTAEVRAIFNRGSVVMLNSNKPELAANIILEKEKKVGGCRDETETHTRCFLSHKRSSAQGMVGRIWQGLKEEYKVFLDSEADFDLHDLKEIVKHTKLFVFVLSEGILDSYWCLQELLSAYKEKKRFLIIRDWQFHLPEVLPDSVPEKESIKKIIDTSPKIDYMAEFYENAVIKIKEHLGPRDEIIRQIEALLAKEDETSLKLWDKQELNKEKKIRMPPGLSLEISQVDFAHALDKYFQVPMKAVRELDFSGTSNITVAGMRAFANYCPRVVSVNLRDSKELLDDGLILLAKGCKGLESIDLGNCQQITEIGVSALLSECKELKSLNLQNCTLVKGTALKDLDKKCPKLETLVLSGMFGIDNKVITQLKGCTGLKSLKLVGCSFDDSAIEALSGLTNLKEVDLTSCTGISDLSVQIIAKSNPGLEVLSLKKCFKVSDEGLKHLSGCKQLKSLNVSYCYLLTEQGILELDCPNLESFHIKFCTNVDTSGVEKIASNCKNLVDINLGGCWRLEETALNAIADNCTKLLKLDMSKSYLTKEYFDAIARIASLQKLSVADSIIEEAGLQSLQNLTNLKVLLLDNCAQTTDDTIGAISKIKSLEHLSLVGCQRIGDKAMGHITAGLANLEYLNLSECSNITDHGLKKMIDAKNQSKLPKIKSLLLAELTDITDRSLETIAKACPNLVELDLGGCDDITDAGMRAIGEKCPELEKLNLRDTGIGPSVCKTLAEGCPKLKELDFTRNDMINDAALNYLTEGCKNIERLNLYDCDTISDTGIKDIAFGCPNLRHLDLAECDKITNKSLKYISAKCFQLQSLALSGDNISDRALKSLLQACANMVELSLTNCTNLTNDSVKFIAEACTKIEVLKIEGIQNMGDEGFEHLVKCPKLRSLIFSGTNLSDNGLEKFCAEAPNIEILDISNSSGNISDKGLESLAKCKYITNLDLEGCNDITDAGIASLAEGCRNIRELVLADCTQITDEAIKVLSQKCSNLRAIDLSNCSQITDASAEYIKTWESLFELYLKGCNITSKGVETIAEKCESIKRLSVTGPAIDDTAVQAITKMASVVWLDLSNTSITDESLKTIADIFGNMYSIYLAGTPITDQGIANMNCRSGGLESLIQLDISGTNVTGACLDNLPSGLRTLNLAKCNGITNESLSSLVGSCPILEDLDLSYNTVITNDGLSDLGDLRDLNSLKLEGCKSVQADDLIQADYFRGGVLDFGQGVDVDQDPEEQYEDWAEEEEYDEEYNEEEEDDENEDNEQDTYDEDENAQSDTDAEKLGEYDALDEIREESVQVTVVVEEDNDDDDGGLVFDQNVVSADDKNKPYADILVVYSAETGNDAAEALKRMKTICGDLVDIKFFACPNGEIATLKDFDQKVIEDQLSRTSSLVAILSKDVLKVKSAVWMMATAHHQKKRIVLVHDQASCFFPGEAEQPDEVKELFHDKAITYMRQYTDVCVRAVLKKALRLSKEYFEICLVYHDSARDVATKFLEQFKGIKTTSIKFSERKGEKAYDFSRRSLFTISVSRALVVLLHESMNDKSGKHFLSAPIQIALMLDPKSRCYVMYDEVNTPVMLDAFAKELDSPEVRARFRKGAVVMLNSNKPEQAAQTIIHQEKKVAGCRDETETHTRCFLSHKRSSAQGMCGRIWQGLKEEYKVFLDSEADFDLHDLKEIVKHTKLFVFVLSEGILDSYWCLQELLSAYKEKKRFLIIRDWQFQLPEVLPDKVPEKDSIKKIIDTSPKIDYMAEFYENAVIKIKEHLGPRDEIIRQIEALLAKEDETSLKLWDKQELNKEKKIRMPPGLSLEISQVDFAHALEKYFQIPLKKVKELDFSGTSNITVAGMRAFANYCPKVTTVNLRDSKELLDDGLILLAKGCKGLESIDLGNCQQITEIGVSALLSECKELKSLNLENCSLVKGTALKDLDKKCPKLETLVLSGMFGIDNKVITQLKGCTGLKSLKLVGCSFDDAGIEALSGLKNLKELDLTSCTGVSDKSLALIASSSPDLEVLSLKKCFKVSDEGLKHLGALKKLKSLNVSYCYLVSDEGVSALDCPDLESFHVKYCTDVEGPGIQHIASLCKNLVDLNLGGCWKLDPDALNAIADNCTKLLKLDLTRSFMNEDKAHAISRMDSLHKINFTDSLLDDAVLATLAGGLSHLKVLLLDDCPQITDDGISHVAKIGSLEELGLLRCTKLGDKSMSLITSGLPKLVRLNLSECFNITDSGIKKMLDKKKGGTKLPQLKYLNVSDLRSITDRAVETIASACPNLIELNLGGCDDITDSGMRAIGEKCHDLEKLSLRDTSIGPTLCKILAEGCPKLKDLDLSENDGINDAALNYLTEGCKNIERLNLYDCDTISDTGIKDIAFECSNLRHLDLAECDRITDKSLKYISAKCFQLQSLALSGDNISDRALKSLLQACANMVELSLTNCTNLTNDSVKFIAEACTKIQTLKLAGIANLGDEGFEHLVKCPKLRSLIFSGTNLSDAGLEKFCAEAPNIEILNLSDSKGNISDKGLESLAKCKYISSLNLQGSEQITDAGIVKLTEGCQNIRELILEGCKQLTDESLKVLSKHCSNMKILNLIDCAAITDASAEYLKTWGSLTELYLRGTQITSAGVAGFAEKCENITSISLSGEGIDDSAVESLCTNLNSVIWLDLSNTNITDAALAKLAQFFPNLYTLCLDDTKITDEGISNMDCSSETGLNNVTILTLARTNITGNAIYNLPAGLKNLDLSGCNGINDECLSDISTYCPSLQVLNLSHITSITNDGISNLTGLSELQSLNLEGCSAVDAQALVEADYFKRGVLEFGEGVNLGEPEEDEYADWDYEEEDEYQDNYDQGADDQDDDDDE